MRSTQDRTNNKKQQILDKNMNKPLFACLVALSLTGAIASFFIYSWDSLMIENTVHQLNNGQLKTESLDSFFSHWLANGDIEPYPDYLLWGFVIFTALNIYFAAYLFLNRGPKGRSIREIFTKWYWTSYIP